MMDVTIGHVGRQLLSMGFASQLYKVNVVRKQASELELFAKQIEQSEKDYNVANDMMNQMTVQMIDKRYQSSKLFSQNPSSDTSNLHFKKSLKREDKELLQTARKMMLTKKVEMNQKISKYNKREQMIANVARTRKINYTKGVIT